MLLKIVAILGIVGVSIYIIQHTQLLQILLGIAEVG
jgi:hypothetical protein